MILLLVLACLLAYMMEDEVCRILECDVLCTERLYRYKYYSHDCTLAMSSGAGAIILYCTEQTPESFTISYYPTNSKKTTRATQNLTKRSLGENFNGCV